MERKPLVNIGGTVYELPNSDSIAGTTLSQDALTFLASCTIDDEGYPRWNNMRFVFEALPTNVYVVDGYIVTGYFE